MEANELRIGNFVYHGYQTPEGISKIKTYHDICYAGFMYGIPLTEEILLKCGLVYDDSMGLSSNDGRRKIYRDSNICLGIDDNGLIRRWSEVEDHWYNDFEGEPILYVHELQNIYY